MTTPNGNNLKPVTESVKALSGTPMLLALIILNLLVLGMVTYLAKARSEQIQEERTQLLQALHNCINQK